MIKIKDEDIIEDNFEEYFFYLRSRYMLSPSKAKQLKQQIHRDHEDAKKLRSENQQLKYERIDLIISGKKDKEDAKKLHIQEDAGLVTMDWDRYSQARKDRQVVKRLEKELVENIIVMKSLENVKSVVYGMQLKKY